MYVNRDWQVGLRRTVAIGTVLHDHRGHGDIGVLQEHPGNEQQNADQSQCDGEVAQGRQEPLAVGVVLVSFVEQHGEGQQDRDHY